MSEHTAIEWCDSTHNEWEGCTKVGPGCDHCYAEARNHRFGGGNWGAGAPRRLTSVSNRNRPLRWNKKPFAECMECGWRGETKGLSKTADVPGMDRPGTWLMCPSCKRPATLKEARRRVFSASLSDWLDNEVPIEWLVGLLDTIRRCPNLDFLLLTKRIGNWRKRLEEADAAPSCGRGMQDFLQSWLGGTWCPPNVWLGATVVNQEEADRDIPKLLAVPARVRFLSIEPMLGPIYLQRIMPCDDVMYAINPLTGSVGGALGNIAGPPLHWVIAGGESGRDARPMHPEWVRRLRDECRAAGVPFLFKQHGEWLSFTYESPCVGSNNVTGSLVVNTDGRRYEGGNVVAWNVPYPAVAAKVGKLFAGRMLDGREWSEFPT